MCAIHGINTFRRKKKYVLLKEYHFKKLYFSKWYKKGD